MFLVADRQPKCWWSQSTPSRFGSTVAASSPVPIDGAIVDKLYCRNEWLGDHVTDAYQSAICCLPEQEATVLVSQRHLATGADSEPLHR
jgi:hypothetical protein